MNHNHEAVADRFLFAARALQWTGLGLAVVALILYWLSDDGRGGRKRLPPPPTRPLPADVDVVSTRCEMCEIRARRELAAART